MRDRLSSLREQHQELNRLKDIYKNQNQNLTALTYE